MCKSVNVTYLHDDACAEIGKQALYTHKALLQALKNIQKIVFRQIVWNEKYSFLEDFKRGKTTHKHCERVQNL